MKLKDRVTLSGFADEIAPQLDVQLRVLNDCGVRCMEIRGVDGKNIDRHTPEETEKIARRLDDAGVSVSAVGSPIGKIGIADDFEPHLERFRHVVEQAKLLGTRYIRMFSFYLPENAEPDQYRDQVLRRLGAMIDYAGQQNVVLLHENEKGIYGDNASRCLDLFQELFCPQFRCTFDFANFVQCRQDPLKAFALLRPYVEYVHVKDALWDSGKVVPAGEGDGHVREILSLLDREGYAGYLSLEPHLVDFSGFAALEKGTAETAALDPASVGEAAFRKALGALRSILEEDAV